jgi:hypothetical protein
MRETDTAQTVATPEELTRTALRLFTLAINEGLYYLPPRVRQSEEARQADRGLRRASEFFSQHFDATHAEQEMRALCAALIPLARNGYCPFRIFVQRSLRRRPSRAGEVRLFNNPGGAR